MAEGASGRYLVPHEPLDGGRLRKALLPPVPEHPVTEPDDEHPARRGYQADLGQITLERGQQLLGEPGRPWQRVQYSIFRVGFAAAIAPSSPAGQMARVGRRIFRRASSVTRSLNPHNRRSGESHKIIGMASVHDAVLQA